MLSFFLLFNGHLHRIESIEPDEERELSVRVTVAFESLHLTDFENYLIWNTFAFASLASFTEVWTTLLCQIRTRRLCEQHQ